MHSEYIKRAIELAHKNIDEGGGPFGAVIVRNGEVVAEAFNSVAKDSDPTAHAEIVAIRKAGKKLNTFNLSECTIYASCEPCPMCLGAIYWARLSAVYFASDREDANIAGFSDSMIYDEIAKPVKERGIKMVQIKHKGTEKLFRKWIDKSDKIPY